MQWTDEVCVYPLLPLTCVCMRIYISITTRRLPTVIGQSCRNPNFPYSFATLILNSTLWAAETSLPIILLATLHLLPCLDRPNARHPT